MEHHTAPIGRTIIIYSAVAFLVSTSGAWTPKSVHDDPLVRMPGTQPEQVVDLESDKNCLSCHAGGAYEMENWQGSMMAQASRDPLFWAGLTVAAQDSIWAVGTPNAGDICIRCHFPQGWLDGRSDPSNASAMRGEDYNGVTCKICHYMYDPFYESTYGGLREGNDWTNYWDEVDVLPSYINATRSADAEASEMIEFFNGNPFYTNNAPIPASYTENGGGHMFLVTHTSGISDGKRGPFADAEAKHDMLYSRYHKSKYFCGTCHDISNPVLANLAYATNAPGDGVTVLPSENQPAYSYGHVERTFSEFMLSAYGLQGGSPGTGPYNPDQFDTQHAGNTIASCQDCHFRRLDGKKAANSGLVRPGESDMHPLSGVPEHRMIGGNLWVPYLLTSIDSGSANYDAVNEALLKQGPEVLTLNFTQGIALDPAILLETIAYSSQMLQSSISMTNANYSLGSNEFTLRLQNHTAHKLISGYPEGRRMFLNIKAYANNELIYEINPYDYTVGTLKGLGAEYSPNSPTLNESEVHQDGLVYEVHQSSSLLGVNETFHMALATERYKDNRIPPKGFRMAEASARLCEPVWHGVSETNYYTAAECAGGYDEVTVSLPAGTERIVAALYYQTTSREFIEFLRDEINGVGGTLPSPGPGSGDPAYLVQTDPFFSGMAAWGDTIWQLWDHNKNVPGAAPVMMTNTYVQLDVTDTDGDGIPAYWEIFHFGGATNAIASLDPDGDGSDNYSEYMAYTIPTDSNSVFSITGEFAATNGTTAVLATFNAHRSRDYVLEAATNLVAGGWSGMSGNVRGNDGEMVIATTNSTDAAMYRVKAQLPGIP